ncbi:hypothetical protein JJJ17_20150 [Paracoccus caeni]|uniref:Uncharacterized protein n=1 Tax=Paracoccus caeni TaxID=657651 RepID=A0A934SJG9_9RHOB|nr:hypothetical protein [Paracoccus caeni]MBK4218246.1 hypothetical protein [Paracoccus caeni]
MKNLRHIILIGATALAAFAYIGGNQTAVENSAQDTVCREIQVQTTVDALKAIFPTTDFGALETSACQAADFVGVDSAGVLVFGGGPPLTGIQLAPLLEPEFLPLATIDRLLPKLNVEDTSAEYDFAYGFDHEWNSGAYVLRKSDGTGPVIVLVADLT